MNEKIQITINSDEFLSLLEKEFDSYPVGEDARFESIDARNELKALFLEMNKHFCFEGIGGLGTCDSIEEYTNSFIYGAIIGDFEDYQEAGFDSFDDYLDYLRENNLYVSESLKRFVESF